MCVDADFGHIVSLLQEMGSTVPTLAPLYSAETWRIKCYLVPEILARTSPGKQGSLAESGT
jgi:hypothetical protein